MVSGKRLRISTNCSLAEACIAVKTCLDDPVVTNQSKVIAIEKVARMGTHNSITKDDLIHCLRWLFDHYNFE